MAYDAGMKPTTRAERDEPEGTYLDRNAFAARLKIKAKSLTAYLVASRKHRAAGQPRPGDIPEPDKIVAGRHYLWLEQTVADFIERRPGRGRKGIPRKRAGT